MKKGDRRQAGGFSGHRHTEAAKRLMSSKQLGKRKYPRSTRALSLLAFHRAHSGSKSVDAPRATAQTLIKQMVLRNLNISTDEIIERMQKAGYDPTRFFVATTKSNFKHALKVIKSLNVDVRKLDL